MTIYSRQYKVLNILIIFIAKGQMAWGYGILMAFGQIIGTYWASNVAIHHPKINIYVRYLLIVIILISIVKFLKLYTFIPILSA